MSVEQARGVRRLRTGHRGRVVGGLPLRCCHLEARAGLGLHAGRREGGRNGLGIRHLAGDLGHHLATLAQGQVDVLVARTHGAGGHGQAVGPRRLAHVHPGLAHRVGGVGVAAGLHHGAVRTVAERAEATHGGVQGVEDGRGEVRDLEHGECAFCG